MVTQSRHWKHSASSTSPQGEAGAKWAEVAADPLVDDEVEHEQAALARPPRMSSDLDNSAATLRNLFLNQKNFIVQSMPLREIIEL